MSDKNKTIYRTLAPEVKVLDAEKGIVEYVASDETLDSHREIVMSAGWKFDRFRKNAPFLNSHSSWSIEDQIGKVISADVKDGKLVETVQWAINLKFPNEVAELGFAMTEAGYLKAVSVGFYAERSAASYDSDWQDAVKEAGLDAATAAMVRRIFFEQQQIELSAVVIGSNPNALAKAYNDGAVSEELLAKCGFGGDDEFDFLQKAAVAVESPECDAAFKAMLGLEMRRIHSAHKNKNLNERKSAPGTAARTRSSAADAEKIAADEASFLTKLNDLTR